MCKNIFFFDVLAWFGSVFVLWLLGTFWLFIHRGAEMLARYPGALELSYGMTGKTLTKPAAIKIIWLLGLATGISAAAATWIMDIPPPPFR